MVESSGNSSEGTADMRSRAEIEQSIKKIGLDWLDRWDELTVVMDEPEYQVRSDWIASSPVMVTKCKAEGLTAAQLAPMVKDPTSVITHINNKMTIDKLPDDADGNMTFHFNIETPPVVSGRSIVTTYYIREDTDSGAITIISGSAGNDEVAASLTELIGNNVVGDMVVSYMHMVPYEGGYNIEQVTCFDPKGWIPSFIQQIGNTR